MNVLGIIKSNPLLQASRHLGVCAEDNVGYITDSNSCSSDPDQVSDLLCLDEDLTSHQNVRAILQRFYFFFGGENRK